MSEEAFDFHTNREISPDEIYQGEVSGPSLEKDSPWFIYMKSAPPVLSEVFKQLKEGKLKEIEADVSPSKSITPKLAPSVTKKVAPPLTTDPGGWAGIFPGHPFFFGNFSSTRGDLKEIQRVVQDPEWQKLRQSLSWTKANIGHSLTLLKNYLGNNPHREKKIRTLNLLNAVSRGGIGSPHLETMKSHLRKELGIVHSILAVKTASENFTVEFDGDLVIKDPKGKTYTTQYANNAILYLVQHFNVAHNVAWEVVNDALRNPA